jgi:S1-C subfamily serine protease
MVRRQGIEGVMILGIEEGSPAARAGLEAARFTGDGRLVPGDIIVGIEGEAVERVEDLLAVLDRHRPGDTVSLRVRQNGDERTLEIELAAGR